MLRRCLLSRWRWRALSKVTNGSFTGKPPQANGLTSPALLATPRTACRIRLRWMSRSLTCYNLAMIQLTPEQREQFKQQQPPRVVVESTEYVLIRSDVYEEVKGL